MKVILLNGSPRANGNTAFALDQMAQVFAENGIETETVQVGHLALRGCQCCGKCYKTGKCIIDDEVNAFAPKLEAADGLVLGSPVYYAAASSTLTAFCDRLFYSTRFSKHMKVGAAVVAARRGGCSTAFDQLNKYFTISGMPVAPSHYWNAIHGARVGEAEQDGEGVATVRNLAKNMVFLMKSIELGKEAFGLPEYDKFRMTSFIRKAD